MKIPAAMARIARIMLRPLRAGINSNRPQAMRKIASKIMPILLVNFNFMVVLLSNMNVGRLSGPATFVGRQEGNRSYDLRQPQLPFSNCRELLYSSRPSPLTEMPAFNLSASVNVKNLIGHLIMPSRVFNTAKRGPGW
jgi:hypothetical protein